jgi:CheY-like chemotaxis protein
VDKGSAFTVLLPLPLDTTKMSDPAQGFDDNASELTKGTVLLVEDYAPNVFVATLILESLGYKTDAAFSGAEALKKLQEPHDPYYAILMDVQMQGMDGYETTRRIRAMENEQGIRHLIIGVTAHALAGDREKCLAAGMDDYMSKPINPDVLADKFNAKAQAA